MYYITGLVALLGSLLAFQAQALTVAASPGLRFGNIIAPTVGTGYVTIDANTESRVVSQGAVTLGLTFGAAEVNITGGTSGDDYTISSPASVTMTDANGNTTQIDNITFSTASPLTLNISGEETFRVGGRLEVDAGLTGNLSGSIPVFITEVNP